MVRVCMVSIVWWMCFIAACNGFTDIPCFYEGSQCSIGLDEDDSNPYYDLEYPVMQNEKRSGAKSDLSTVISNLSPEGLKDFLQKNKDLRYVKLMSRPETSFIPRLGRRKRSLVESLDDSVGDEDYGARYKMFWLPSNFMRQMRNTNNVKTFHLPSSVAMEMNNKRSASNSEANHPGAITGRSQHVINLNAGNAFTPRMGRSQTIHMN